ncbi:replication factor C subunit 1 [Leptidea sinapis]|uniref:replication factor C subunit 1 n=1 Tax=Leptidea sinapis TaxID=189913 RepID=UPI002144172B|nr:replication factor C subunit 1 [Leptidea sinapis]
MSRNIRSYFTVQKRETKVKEEDSDEIPESPDVQIVNKKKQSRKKRQIEDSDEEILTPKKKKTDTTPQSKHQKSPKALKEVTITDLFGAGKIKKTEALVIKDKKGKKTETGIHSDDEFEKSLLELDENKVQDLNKSQIESLSGKEKINDKSHEIENKSKKSHRNETDKEVVEEKKLDTIKSNNKSNCGLDVLNNQEKSRDLKNKIHSDPRTEKKLDKLKLESKKTESSKNESKCNYSEFLSNDDSKDSDDRKRKHNTSLNESVLSDEERYERKRHSAALYQKYLNRSGPKHLGAKEIPDGAPDCLKDCAFLLTGVLDSFEREEVVAAITKYGGTIKNSVSKKVTHVLVGDDAGPAKTAKAQELGIKIISEDDFLKMISESLIKKIKVEPKPNKDKTIKEVKKDANHVKSKLKEEKEEAKQNNHDKLKSRKDTSIEKSKYFDKEKQSISNVKEEKVKIEKNDVVDKDEIHNDKIMNQSEDNQSKMSCGQDMTNQKNTSAPSLMWVDKYKPQSIKSIIGQQGEGSNVKKLINWLTKWYTNRKAKLTKPNPWAKNDDGGYYKAALLSGPPGVGKTTTVSLVCKELGFDMVEFNASDTRSKTLIKDQISELLTTTSLSGFARGATGKQAVTRKHVLVMDEVDGMAGNEDRGGLQELISLIKVSSVPIICMCNDRNSEKMRSLVNYCYDLRFSRPRVDQIKAAMLSICFKEGVKISPDVMSQIVVSANQDVRQTLHLLSMWSADPNLMQSDNLRREADKLNKDIRMGPWEAIRKVFSEESHRSMSINDKSDLFFSDYSLVPLFVHENYLNVAPHCPKNEVLDRMSRAADSISQGDLVDKRIRSQQAWSLLPLQAMYSSVIPGSVLSGHVAAQIQFPGWLGRNSRASKMARLAQQIHAHTRLTTSGSKSSIHLDYAHHLRDAILNPLIADKMEGIEKSLAVLEAYHLLREDLDSLTELSLWPGQRNPNVLIDSKVKAAMTRTYNKQASALPYAPGAVKKTKHTQHEGDEEAQTYDDDDEEMEHDSDPENDALIKKKKLKHIEKTSSKEKPKQPIKGKKKK